MGYHRVQWVVLTWMAKAYLIAALIGLCGLAVPLLILLRLLHIPGWLLFDGIDAVLRVLVR
jgi:hypothetical protein